MISSIKDCTVLNNGLKMPWLGLGVYGLKNGGGVEKAIQVALDAGYRSIDTAAFYKNERGVGKAIRQSGIPREEIFLTTKVWNDAQRKQRTLAAFEESLERLGTDYIDLYLIHWPVNGRYKETWGVLEEIYESGRTKAIGVSNFMTQHLEDLLPFCRTIPAINQVEFHPYLIQPDLLKLCQARGIQMEAWSPLMKGRITSDKAVKRLADKYGKTPAQLILRWDIQKQVVTIPKSGSPERIRQNADIFDFEISPQDMAALDALDENRRIGDDPYNITF